MVLSGEMDGEENQMKHANEMIYGEVVYLIKKKPQEVSFDFQTSDVS